MTIWILAVLCLVIYCYAGHGGGAIRISFSFLGLFFGALFAKSMGGLVAYGLKFIFKDPVTLAVYSTVVGFFLIYGIFLLIGNLIHKKVEVAFKYDASDTKFTRWRILNARTGLCLGTLSAMMAFFLITMVFYVYGYMTVQTSRDGSTPIVAKIANMVAKDVDAAGLAGVMTAIDPMPERYYDAADVLGLLSQDRGLLDRAARYPDFLEMSEDPYFLGLLRSGTSLEVLRSATSLKELKEDSVLKNMLNDSLLYEQLGAIDLVDLRTYLESGESPKYADTPIIGRWDFNLNKTLEDHRAAQPRMRERDFEALRLRLATLFYQAELTALPSKRLILRVAPLPDPNANQNRFQQAPQPNTVAMGEWTRITETRYSASFSTISAEGPGYDPLRQSVDVRLENGNLLADAYDTTLQFRPAL